MKQGCVLAPTLFDILFSVVLQEGIEFEFRTNGDVFNLRRLQAETKVLKNIQRDL